MEPGYPRVGETVKFSIRASHPTEYCCMTTFYPGDGTPSEPPVMAPNPCPPPQPSVFTREVEHVYRAAGRVTVAVQPSAFPFCRPGMPMPINGHLHVLVQVEP